MTAALDWDLVANDFVADGALRDIIVEDTALEDWQRVCDHARSSSWNAHLTSSEGDIEWPTKFAELFPHPDSSRLFLLTLRVGPIAFYSHFFTTAEIEFDVDPREVTEQSFPALQLFVRELGQVVGRDVVVTYENALESAFIRYNHQDDLLQCIPASDH